MWGRERFDLAIVGESNSARVDSCQLVSGEWPCRRMHRGLGVLKSLGRSRRENLFALVGH